MLWPSNEYVRVYWIHLKDTCNHLVLQCQHIYKIEEITSFAVIEIVDEKIFYFNFKMFMQPNSFSKYMFPGYGNRNVWREQKNYKRAHIEIKQLSHGSMNVIRIISIWHISQEGQWKLPGVTRTRKGAQEPS